MSQVISQSTSQSLNDVFVVDACRTPIGRYGGSLSAVRPDDLLAHVLHAILSRNPNVPAAAVDEVIAGCANQAGEDNRNVARMAALLAGLPAEVPGVTVNRLCASGLQAVADGFRQIAVGEAHIVLASGVESMSRAPFVLAKSDSAFSRNAEIYDTTIGWRFTNPKLSDLYYPFSMGETAENVAERYGISREDQDAFALQSQERYQAAHAAGRFAAELVPVEIPQRKGAALVVDKDEHPRATTLADLAKLKPAFKAGGTVTAGTASGVNDGAAAVLLASAQAVKDYGLKPLVRIVGTASAGVDPAYMGVGPVPATQKLLARTGLKVSDLSAVELNEAFAAQSLAVVRELGLDPAIVNPNGGAIAIGHPLGASGARLLGTLVHELIRREGRYGLASLCVGVGQGLSVLVERV